MRDARKYLDKYKRIDLAVDAFYNDPHAAAAAPRAQASSSKLGALFDKYKGASACAHDSVRAAHARRC